MKLKPLMVFLLLCGTFSFATVAQEASHSDIDVRSLKKREILSLSREQLANLSFEDIIYISGKFGISIDELLEASVSVSTKSALTPRETPGIISIITDEQIQNSGASNLYELLRTVPGIYFGYDVDGVIGITMRGNWGHEGKVLFLIDDMELNEGMYSVVPLIKHISAEQISRIEVIRGPGSALYGGYAELGVIRVITKNGNDLKGTQIGGSAATFTHGISNTGAHFATGNLFGQSDFSLLATWNKGHRTSGDFTDFNGDTYSMHNGWSDTEQLQLNLKYAHKGFDSNLFFSNYYIVPTGYDEMVPNRFRNLLGRVRYAFQPTDNIRITPSLFYKTQTPYNFKSENWFYQRHVSQINGSVDMVWQMGGGFQLLGGVGTRQDIARIGKSEQNQVGEEFYNDKFELTHNTVFLYTQASYSGAIGNFFGGLRFEDHSVTGSNIAPRLGYTKVFNRFNLKYLYSHAFRSPSIENINANEEIEPERTIVNELELGYRLSNNVYANVSLFDIVIKDPIVYSFDYDTETEFYLNDNQAGTSGVEMEVKTVFDRWSGAFSYAYYTAARNNKTDYYSVFIDGNEKKRLLKGAPAHILHLQGTTHINNRFFVTTSLSWHSAQYGFVTSDEEQEKMNAYLLADITFRAKNLIIRNLDFTLSFRNILNETYAYIQPFGMANMAEAPYPGAPFETRIKVLYSF
ncbi:TonB-dependent receptor plug domain-containing protein [Alkaliflexus imshenetskii]|uniref:TonB-dependent receptor plug domain-containing protein n=1 Tax=Alkaliflexus imshenetskii TaxID=286730 RepID=UPI000478B431|nr:TonB-dependent receptor plug domain-containing protein [Alkaliflexus imshenetskii]